MARGTAGYNQGNYGGNLALGIEPGIFGLTRTGVNDRRDCSPSGFNPTDFDEADIEQAKAYARRCWTLPRSRIQQGNPAAMIKGISVSVILVLQLKQPKIT